MAEESIFADVTEGAPSTPDPAVAPSPEAAPSAPPQEQQIPYTRFRDVIGERNHWQQQYQALAQRLASLERQPAPAPAPMPTRMPEMKPGYDEAGRIVAEIMRQHPEFQTLRQIQEAMPAILQSHLQTQQGLQQALQQAQAVEAQYREQTITSESERLGQLAHAAGLPTSPEQLELLSHQVNGLIRGNPQAYQAYLQGNRQVLNNAVKLIADYRGAARPQAALQQTKLRTAALPPRSAGGSTPGGPLPPKPTTEREFFRMGNERLKALIAERQEG